MLKKLLFLLLSLFFLCSCNVSFPKETLQQDTENFIKQEANVDCSVYIIGTTMYLDVVFDDLVTNDSEKINDIYKTLQKIVSAAARVPLSSDKDIKIVVISAFDSNYQTLLRIFENIDDIKKYSHQLISREDYEERQLMEFVSSKFAKETIESKHDISTEEYVARLIISQINNIARKNPFLGTLIQTLELRFVDYDAENFYFESKNFDNNSVKTILEKIFEEELVKNLQKYKLFSKKSAILLDREKNIIFSLPINS